MRILTVLGTRPEIIRLSRIIPRLDALGDHVLVHTGQNHAANLSQVFFDELNLRAPDIHMGVDTSGFGRQLATLFEGFEEVLDRVRPKRVLLLGDTNSALVAFNCKRRQIPVYHMEAGNRCHDDRVPEEVNRRVIDHCSSVLLPYTHRSADNLVKEGIDRQRIFVTGNPIREVVLHHQREVDESSALERYGFHSGGYLLATLHRAENVDSPPVFAQLCRALEEVAELYGMPLLLSVHPRVEAALARTSFAGVRVRAAAAMPFFDFVRLEQNAALVLTDSGTVQEECAIFGVPVLTVRDTTERPETVEAGSNIVTSTDPARILAAARFLRECGATGAWTPPPEYMALNVAETVVRIILGNHDLSRQIVVSQDGNQQSESNGSSSSRRLEPQDQGYANG
jgi:UDP-N-acetylglucosamine 2-epimerase (non-hydrolysing)